MPHKHKRQRRNDDAPFDLPPTSIAKSLPAFQRPAKDAKSTKTANGSSNHKKTDPKPVKTKNKPNQNPSVDDTPKSFARLMQFHTLGKRLPKGLDDGTTTTTNQPPGKKTKKRKIDTTTHDSHITTSTPKGAPAAPPVQPLPQPTTTIPTILPGERLSDFAARVDQALPIAGLLRRGTDTVAKLPTGLAERPTTKHNKRLARMQKEWRAAEARRIEKREEERDELEDEQEEQGLLWDGVATGQKRKNKKKAGSKTRKKGVIDGDGNGDEDEDPWKALERRRATAKQRNLQDVVQAPPDLKNMLVIKGGSRVKDLGGGVGVDVQNVPGRAGSLRKREELGEARSRVIEGYRKRVVMGRKGVGGDVG